MIEVGDMVTLFQPTLHGSAKHAGKVIRFLPSGKVEIRMQQGGYDVVHVASVTKVVRG